MKYYLFDHAGCHNRGCEAIIRGTVNILTKTDKEASFKLASHHPENDTALNMDIVKIEGRQLSETEKIAAAVCVKLSNSEKYFYQKKYSSVIEQALDCDIVLSVGGDTYCYGDNTSTVSIIEKIHKKGKKVVLWGASIGEQDLTEEKIKSLRSFDAVFVREPVTYRNLEKYVKPSKLFMFSDPAFCMEREDLPLPEGFIQGKTLGFNLSPLVCGKNEKLLDSCVEFLKYIIEKTDFQIALIPHVIEQGNNDCDVLDDIYNRLDNKDRVIKIPGNLNAKQYKGYIARLKYFIGARTHATIAAYSNYVPTIVLGYSVKSRGIAEDLFGDERFVIDSLKVESGDTLIKEFNKLCENENEISSVLRSVIPERIKSSVSAGAKLSEI